MTPINISQLFSPSFLNESPLTKTLGEEFVLCESGNMVFHWADFFETCDHVKSQLEKNPELMKDFKMRENALARLSLIPVWIRTDKKVHQTTMFELYEKYILNQIHLLGGIDPFSPLEVSFISGTGPYKAMSVAECFNKVTYRDFILVYLIQGKLPRRDFRIRLKSKVLMEFGKSFMNAEVIGLEQLTMNGMLLSMDAETYLSKVASEEYVRLLLNTKTLGECKGKNLTELKTYLSQFAFNLLYSSHKEDALTIKLSDISVQSSFDFSMNRRIFLFISYDKLAETHPASVKVIKDFVTEARGHIKNYYKDLEKTA